MPSFRRTLLGAAAVGALVMPRLSQAQRQDSVTVVPGASYGSGGFERTLLGTGWRDAWITPIKVPVFDLQTYAGGLKIDKRGGGFQTVTLHLTERDGWKEYRFRSVNKFPQLEMPGVLAGTLAARIIADQTGNLFPAAPVAVAPFMRAIDALHVPAELYVMPDTPLLGEHRAMFGGLLGTVELKGEEAPDDKPGFAGSTKVKETEKFFEDLAETQANRIDEREFLAARMVDFLINDTDRTPDNIDWARFGEKGDYLWRPILRDRDRAFTNGSGLIHKLIISRIYPKFSPFTEKYSFRGLTQSSYTFDRRLLQRLTARDFAEVAGSVQRAMSDSVIEAAIATLPPEWRRETDTDERLREILTARRAGLPAFAMRFYADLAREPDVRMTGDAERAEIVRHEDGSVTVTVPRINAPAAVVAEVRNPAGGATRTMAGDVDLASRTFYQRTFLPSETNEVRVYLGGGADTAVVRGATNDAILVRIIGDAGDDVLADSAGGGATYLYDAEGDNQFVTARGTQVNTKAWKAPSENYGFTIGAGWRPDWGGSRGWAPVVKYGEGAGLIVGVGPKFKRYGFRRLPHLWSASTALMVGTGNGRLGVTGEVDYRGENSPMGLRIAGRATKLEAMRFYGYGNDTPDVGSDLSLVQQTVMGIEPSIFRLIGYRARELRKGVMQQDTASAFRPMTGRVDFGPVVTWFDPDPAVGSPLTSTVRGERSFMHTGLRLAAELDRTDSDPVPTAGWRMKASASTNSHGTFTDFYNLAAATASAYVPLGLGQTNLAVRVGGSAVDGDFPAQFAANLGGSTSLRGYRSRRFAGDRTAYGSTELRVPVGTLNFIVRSKVGVFALGDVGRVWYGGASDGGWHTGVGGGVWASALGKVVTFTYARGEQERFYLKTGLAF